MRLPQFVHVPFLLLLPLFTHGQERYFTRMGEASFSFTTKMGEVQAANHTATSMFDPNDGSIELSMLMKAFEFEKAAMQDQFNNELMESDAWPKAVFTGRLLGISGWRVQQSP
jgi:hypothetical protein